MADVFASYQHDDRARVELIVGLLEQAGLSVWWDQGLRAGERFDTAIAHELKLARCVLVAWSATSIDSAWVRDEAADGRKRGILVPYSLDGTEPPLGFRQYQTPNLRTWRGEPDDPRIRQLIQATADVASKPVAALPPPTSDDHATGSSCSSRWPSRCSPRASLC